MGLADIEQAVRANIPGNEAYVGSFATFLTPGRVQHLLLGSLAGLLNPPYLTIITDRRLYFVRLTILGKLQQIQIHEYQDISSISVRPSRLFFGGRVVSFDFKNGGRLKLRAVLRTTPGPFQLTPMHLDAMTKRLG